MNKLKVSLLSLAMAGSMASFSSLATESATVNVKGSITPAACAINVTGAADYGTVTAASVTGKEPVAGGYQLGQKTVAFNISCSRETAVAFRPQADAAGEAGVGVVDNNGTTITNVAALGSLGRTATLVNIGNYYIDYNMPFVDNVAGFIIGSQDGTTWTLTNSAFNQDGSTLYAFRHIMSGANTPEPVTNVSGNIIVSAAINPTAISELDDVLSFDTNTTLTLEYV
ncbi:DUF1120 domain-containing protein [Erwinia sp. CGal63]|uniref:DUF1120 domain-containing protein n=1 Tax=Erwinia sp. CGal63 TaxID=2919889 RepID=UPI00300AC483